MRDGLERLLRPRSVAVVGGGAWCASVVEQCGRMGFGGEVWAVHPTRGEVGGARAYPSVDALPGVPDAAFVGVNREASVDAVRALARRGAGGAVCFAAGFRETDDGIALERALLDAAGDMRLLGPNCYGLLNHLDGVALWPDQHGGERVARGVAILAQSSNIAINLTMQRRGLPVAAVATLGNAAQTGVAELGRALLLDPRVTALGLYLEGVGDLAAFEALANEARRLGKGVVALKSGRSAGGRGAAVSHTAALAGEDAGADALFRRLGVGRVHSLPALLQALVILHVAGPLASPRIASMSCSGGEAGLVADAGEDAGLVFPPLDEPRRTALAAALGPRVALANPLDYHTYCWGDADTMAAVFTAMLRGADLALGLVVLDLPRADRCSAQAWEPALEAAARAAGAVEVPVAVLATLPEGLPETAARRLLEHGIVPLAGVCEAMDAIRACTAGPRVATDPAPLLPPGGPRGRGRTLTEAAGKAELAVHGLRVPAGERAQGPDDAAAAADRVGYPVALKGEGVAHKTEAAAVALDLFDADAVRAAAGAMDASSFLVERMVEGAVVELLVGVLRDPAHGHLLTLAPGGTLAELMDDRATLLVPAPREAVREALEGLRIAPVLRGHRGRPGADVEAVVDAVMAVQGYVAAARPLEVEVNPLVCTPKGAWAADVLIVASEEGSGA